MRNTAEQMPLTGLEDAAQLRLADLAAYAGLHPRSIQKLKQRGAITAYTKAEIDRYRLEQPNTRPAPTGPPRAADLPHEVESLRQRVTGLEQAVDTLVRRLAGLEHEKHASEQLVTHLQTELNAARHQAWDRERELLGLLKIRLRRELQPRPQAKPPAPGTTRYRILEYLRSLGGKATPQWKILQALHLPPVAGRTIRRLEQQGFIIKIKPAVYALPPTTGTRHSEV